MKTNPTLNEVKRQLARSVAAVEKRPFNQVHQAISALQYATFQIQEILKPEYSKKAA